MDLNVDTSTNWIKKEMQLTQSSKKLKNNIPVTLLYATKEEKFNNAVALRVSWRENSKIR